MLQGVELIFIDNPTVSTSYIKQLMNIAEKQALVAKTALESTVKLLLIVELDRVEQERETLVTSQVKDTIFGHKLVHLFTPYLCNPFKV